MKYWHVLSPLCRCLRHPYCRSVLLNIPKLSPGVLPANASPGIEDSKGSSKIIKHQAELRACAAEFCIWSALIRQACAFIITWTAVQGDACRLGRQ